MNINEAIKFIEKISSKNGVLSLSRVTHLLSSMGNPEKELKCVHIAGTNGKGSTASMIASVLKEAGYKTGLYTSPYIHTFNERIQINGTNINDEELIEAIEGIKGAIEGMEEKPSEFDIVTAIGFHYFNKVKCDIVVLEVGLGGRLDSTNACVLPEAAVITAIGLDHTKELGNTIEKIASEKAGIIKKDCDVVLYEAEEEVAAIIRHKCVQTMSMLHEIKFDDIEVIESNLKGQTFNYLDFKNIEINLLGGHQLKNAAVSLKTIEVLIKRGWKISQKNIQDGMKSVKWPGRFEILNKKPYFIVDGAHNPQGVEALIKNIGMYFNKKVIFLTGVFKDKDYEKMFEMIYPYGKKFITVQPDNQRSLDYKYLAMLLKEKYKQTEVYDVGDVQKGIDVSLRGAKEDDIIVAFGSLYIVGSVREYFLQLKIKEDNDGNYYKRQTCS